MFIDRDYILIVVQNAAVENTNNEPGKDQT